MWFTVTFRLNTTLCWTLDSINHWDLLGLQVNLCLYFFNLQQDRVTALPVLQVECIYPPCLHPLCDIWGSMDSLVRLVSYDTTIFTLALKLTRYSLWKTVCQLSTLAYSSEVKDHQRKMALPINNLHLNTQCGWQTLFLYFLTTLCFGSTTSDNISNRLWIADPKWGCLPNLPKKEW